jgi:hypothetical protein
MNDTQQSGVGFKKEKGSARDKNSAFYQGESNERETFLIVD